MAVRATITIDLDPTDDPTHGAQQLTFFNGHYDSWCYLPLLAFVTFDREVEQDPCAAVLRPGNAPATRGARACCGVCSRCLRPRFRRPDSWCASMAALRRRRCSTCLDAEPGLDYVVAMAENTVLTRVAEPAMVEARAQSDASGQTEHVYTETRYAARTWGRERRVVIKAEVVRLAGSRAPRQRALRRHDAAADAPLRLRTGLLRPRRRRESDQGTPRRAPDRAHELRSLLGQSTARPPHGRRVRAACRRLRLRAARTACARTQVTGLRDRLLKLGVHVVVSVRRIVLHLPDLDARPRRVAPHRARARRPCRLTTGVDLTMRARRRHDGGAVVACPHVGRATASASSPTRARAIGRAVTGTR